MKLKSNRAHTVVYTNSFQEPVPPFSYVAELYNVDDVMDIIVDNVMLLLYWMYGIYIDHCLVQKKHKG